MRKMKYNHAHDKKNKYMHAHMIILHNHHDIDHDYITCCKSLSIATHADMEIIVSASKLTIVLIIKVSNTTKGLVNFLLQIGIY